MVLADFDNELVVDLDNLLSIENFLHLVKRREAARLVELFPPPDELCVVGPEGGFVSELVVPFARTANPPESRAPAAARATVQRRFAPGSEWLYAKLYTGPAVADRLLVELVTPGGRRSAHIRSIDGWFFIRYVDPEPHLRLRLHGDPGRLARDVLPMLADSCAPFVEDGQISRWQLETYVREVERYGGDAGVVLAERMFGADSACVLAMLPSVPGDEGLAWRWKLALCGIDLLLDALGLSPDEKVEWVRQRRDAFASEFRVNSHVKHQLGEKHRAERQAVDDLLRLARGAGGDHYPAIRALHQRTRDLVPIVQELRLLEQTGRLAVPLSALAASYAHMHVNRLLRSAHRFQELVLYELLDRAYRAQLAQAAPA